MSSPSASPQGRRVLVARVTGPAGEQIQAWRERYDLVEARRLPPHLTLCYWAPVAEPAVLKAQVRHAFRHPVVVRLGAVRAFDNPEGTFYVEVLDSAALDELRRRLYDGTHLALPRRPDWTWHVTRVRRSTGRDVVALRRAASALDLDCPWSVDAIAYLELRGVRYETIREWHVGEPPDPYPGGIDESAARDTTRVEQRSETMTSSAEDRIREAVKTRYGAIAVRLAGGQTAQEPAELTVVQSGTDCCRPEAARAAADESARKRAISQALYVVDEVSELPPLAVLASLGCGNPTALAELQPGEVVLDLGSGGGIDVFLSARRVGPTGFAYGLDMTEEMLDLARRNAAERGITNVAFLKGTIEDIPLPDESVDVVISNCVVNLSPDKAQVLREASRVLRSGGRFAVSDIVARGALPTAVRRDMELWAGCLAGALEEDAYRRLLVEAGFEEVGMEVTRELDLTRFAERTGASLAELDGRLVSAFVRARKPPAGA